MGITSMGEGQDRLLRRLNDLEWRFEKLMYEHSVLVFMAKNS